MRSTRHLPAAVRLLPILLLAPAPWAPAQEEASLDPRSNACCLERIRGAELDAWIADPDRVVDAIEHVDRDLVLAPDVPAVLDRASRAYEAVGYRDRALWYAISALEAGAEGKLSDSLEERIEEWSPDTFDALELTAALQDDYFDLAQNAQRRKLYANALELYLRCAGTRHDRAAQKKIDKLFEDDKAIRILLESGVEIPVQPTTRRSREWIERQNAAHSTWEDPHVLKGDNYTVVTNLGYELAERILLAMEQMNQLYREVYQHKLRGGNMARCEVRVHATRASFDRVHPGKPPGVRGFYSSNNYVVTYDPRDDGRDLESLWSTLFHEASHQFTRVTMAGLVPGWLNEGTSSYFEGARILPSGQIEKNGIPHRRLRNAVNLFQIGRPTLRDVISYYERGSYPGAYYPIGWALVYFLHNYENEESERIYLEAYRDFQRTYKSGERHDPFERFVEYFVERPDNPAVADFEDFEALFQEWIQELDRLEFGSPEVAEELVARGIHQSENDQWEAALQSFRWALRKRPGDIPALWWRARAMTTLGMEDGAIASAREALDRVRAVEERDQPLPGLDLDARELGEECLELISRNDRNFGRALRRAEQDFVSRVEDGVAAALEEELPISAMHLVQNGLRSIGREPTLLRLERELRALGEGEGLHTRRWRALCLCTDLKDWTAPGAAEEAGAWRVPSPGSVETDARGLTILDYDHSMPADFEFEVEIEAELHEGEEGPPPAFGLQFGTRRGDRLHLFSVQSGGTLSLLRLRSSRRGMEQDDLHTFQARAPGSRSFSLRVSRQGEAIGFWLDGRHLDDFRFAPHELGDGIGLFAQGVSARFGNARVRY